MAKATATWAANTEPDFKEYRLYRSVNAAPRVLFATIPKGTQTFVDDPLPVIDGSIGYDLTAVDAVGNESFHTLTVTKTVNLVPPAAPSGLDVVIS